MKADIKSSGIAAPALTHHFTRAQPPTLLPAFAEDQRNGANNFMLLLARVHEISEKTVHRFGGDVDGRDYKVIAFEIETAIYANLLGSGQAIREGFLRALADYLVTHEDGFGLPTHWDPLRTTAAAFEPQGAAA